MGEPRGVERGLDVAVVGDAAGLPDPVPLPLAGFYHPDWPRVESSIAAVEALPGGQGTVAIAVNSATLTSDDVTTPYHTRTRTRVVKSMKHNYWDIRA